MNKVPYDAKREIVDIRNNCCDILPVLDEHHYEILDNLEIKKTNAMRTNRTWFYVQEIYRYCKEIKVMRTAHMGETRGGKSEEASMSAFIHATFFNKLLAEGHFDKVDVGLEKRPISFDVDCIHRNDMAYIDYVRTQFKEKKLVYGEVHQIDEREVMPGGLGTMTSYIELRNYNNIIAKYNIGEHWIYPSGFMDMNIAYGIHWFIKDVKKRLNWGLLYKISSISYGINNQTFLGWVCFPLHKNQEFRDGYERKKNEWIEKVIEGGGDPRAEQRRQAASIVSKNKMFMKMKSPARFVLTNDQQLDIIDTLIAKGKLITFNAEERKRILSRAQLLVKLAKYPEEFGDDNEQ